MRYIYIILICLLLSSCDNEDIEMVNLRVNHYKESAVGLYPTLVFLIQEGDKIGSDEWQYSYSGINGFDYEWGYIYDLKIVKRKVDNPLQDASSIEYILNEIVSKTPVETDLTFKIRLQSSISGIRDLVNMDNDLEYVLSYEQNIDCADLCQQMAESLSNQDEVTGVFIHSDFDKIELKELLFE